MDEDREPAAPIPPRRRRRRWPYVVAALVVAVAAASAGLLRTGSLERIAREFVNSKLERSGNLRLTWRSVQGNPLRRVDVRGLRVELRDKSRRWHRFLEAERVTVDAGIPQLLKAARLRIEMDSPRVWLTVDTSGAVLLPVLKSEGGGGGAGLEIAPLAVRDGSLWIERVPAAPELWAAGVEATARVNVRREAKVDIERLRARLPARGLTLDSLAGALELGDRGWTFRRLDARGPGFAGRFEGRYASDRDYLLDARLDSLADGVVSPWLASKLPPARFSGTAHLRQVGARLSFEEDGRLAAPGFGTADVAMRGEWLGPTIRLSAWRVTMGGAQALGSGTVQPAGRARLELAVSGVDPAQLVFLPPAWRIAQTELNAGGAVELEWGGGALKRVAGRAAVAPSRVRGHRVQAAAGVFEYQPGQFSVDSLEVSGPGGRASGRLAFGPESALRGSGTVSVSLDSLEVLSRSTGERFSGRLEGSWQLAGAAGRPELGTRAELADFRWRGISTAAATADVRWQGPSVSGLAARLHVSELRVGDVVVEGADLDGQGGPVTRFRLTAAHRDSTVEGEGQVDWRARRLTVESGALVLGAKRWSQRGESEFSWAGDSLAWSRVHWGSPDGDSIGTDGCYRPSDGSLRLDFHARRWDLRALTAHFLRQRAPDGLLSGDIHVDGSLADPRCTLDAQVERGVFGGHPLDRISAGGTLRDGRLDLDHWGVEHGGSSLLGRLSLDFPEVRRHGLKALVLPMDSLFRSATATGNAGLQPLELASLGDFNEDLRPLSGRATGRVEVRGPLSTPMVTADLIGEDVTHGDLRLGRVTVQADYEAGSLKLRRAASEMGGETSVVEGTLPCRLSLDPVVFRLEDREMELRLRAPQVDLAVLATLFPDAIAYSSGRAAVDARVHGRPRDPRFQGSATVTDATLRFAGREEVFRGVQGDIALEDRTVRVRSLRGLAGRGGSVEGSGSLEWDQRGVRAYHFDVQAVDVPISDQQNYSGLVRGALQVDPLAPGNRNPLVHGRLVVAEGLMLMEFGRIPPTLEETREKPVLRWYYDLEVSVPGNLWWKNSQSDIEVAGDIRARNLGGFNEGYGSFEIQRGTFDVYDTSFRIEESPAGTVVFSGPIENPALNLRATAQASNMTITLTVPGTRVFELNQPGKLRLSSGGLSEAEIITMLTVGKFTRVETPSIPGTGPTVTGTAPGATPLSAPLGNLLLRRVQRELGIGFSRFLDVFELGTDPTAGRFEVSRVGLGKYVTRDLFVRYGQTLSSNAERDLSLEWRLNKYLFLKGQTVRRALGAAEADALQTSYNLDLKVKFDY
ncbi:MAG: translocation/assembly module TamB domain-containing protein [Candidatus Eisenbacteria bacterium]|nr:translocation/assembly module TamB domain-containing protein [Candidatus Eisenbacteria bacterium]